MGRYNSKVLSHRLIFVLISFSSLPIDGLIFTSTSSDVLSATQPLQREIDSLKEKLDMLEGKHDTLEAATEQFRLQAKHLKQKLDLEKVRYDDLMVVKVDLESKHKEQVDDLRHQLIAAQKQGATVEHEHQDTLQKHRQRELKFHNQLSDKSREVSSCKGKLDQSNSENQKMKMLLKEKDDELSEARATYHKLRQELFIANEQLREYEQSSRSTILSLCLKMFTESKASGHLFNFTGYAWSKLTDDMLPEMTSAIAGHRENLRVMLSSRKGIWKSLRDFVPSIESIEVQIAESLSTTLQSLSEVPMPFPQEMAEFASSFIAKYIESPAREFRSSLLNHHSRAAQLLDEGLAFATTYYIKELGGLQDDFIHTAGLNAQAHSSMILVVLEIFGGLLAFYMAAVISDSFSNKKKHAAKKISIPVAPKGIPKNASLLRSAGGLSRRPQ